MNYTVIIACLLAGWASLLVFSGEHRRQRNEAEAARPKPAPPPPEPLEPPPAKPADKKALPRKTK